MPPPKPRTRRQGLSTGLPTEAVRRNHVWSWDFGANGTIRNMDDLNAFFQYHDQFSQFNNGNGSYGSDTIAPNGNTALPNQLIEGSATGGESVREFFAEHLRTYLVPLYGATTVDPEQYNVGCGSFVAKWELPNGGSLLGQDIIWETRVRYETPKYFWFAIWTTGNKWKQGAEMDLVESFGYNNGGGYTNYDGRYWHSGSVGGTDDTSYQNCGNAMSSKGIVNYDTAEYHIWTWVYRKDNTYSAYVDGIEVQSGSIYWTFEATANGEPIDMTFLFDGAWGHTKVSSVNFSMPASELDGAYYDWDYSRIYLRP